MLSGMVLGEFHRCLGDHDLFHVAGGFNCCCDPEVSTVTDASTFAGENIKRTQLAGLYLSNVAQYFFLEGFSDNWLPRCLSCVKSHLKNFSQTMFEMMGTSTILSESDISLLCLWSLPQPVTEARPAVRSVCDGGRQMGTM